MAIPRPRPCSTVLRQRSSNSSRFRPTTWPRICTRKTPAIFGDVPDKDVRESLQVGQVPMPELAPDEVLVAVMASSINYNTVWSATFEPVPTFDFLRRFARQGGWAARHDLPHHVVGSDAAGVVVRVGAGGTALEARRPRRRQPGLRRRPGAGAARRRHARHRAAGLGLRDQLRRPGPLRDGPGQPADAQAAPPDLGGGRLVTLCGGTAYRMLVGDRGARIKQGDVVLIWGAAGGLGAYAVQLVQATAAVSPSAWSAPRRRRALLRRLGCDVVIHRNEIGLGDARPRRAIELGKRLGGEIRGARSARTRTWCSTTSAQATFGISVFVVRKGGTVVTCGSSTGYEHQYDNRYLWMSSSGSSAATARTSGAVECNRLFQLGRLAPDAVRGVPARRGRRGRPAGADQPAHRQGRRAVPGPEDRASASPTPQLRARIGTGAAQPAAPPRRARSPRGVLTWAPA